MISTGNTVGSKILVWLRNLVVFEFLSYEQLMHESESSFSGETESTQTSLNQQAKRFKSKPSRLTKVSKNMRPGFYLISLINIYAAVPIAPNNSSDWLTGETVFMYPTDENERCYHTWEYFYNECEMRGHQGLASRNEVLSFRQHQESPIDSSSSWTPVQGTNYMNYNSEIWMQIGNSSGS